MDAYTVNNWKIDRGALYDRHGNTEYQMIILYTTLFGVELVFDNASNNHFTECVISVVVDESCLVATVELTNNEIIKFKPSQHNKCCVSDLIRTRKELFELKNEMLELKDLFIHATNYAKLMDEGK